MIKRTVLYFLFAAALCCAGGCFDCIHELIYGNRPPPETPIAPPAHPMPGDYTPADAVAFMTDSLIFALSALSENGNPAVSPAKSNDLLAQCVYSGLIRADVIAQPDAAKPAAYLLFSRRLPDGSWNLTLETPDRKTAAFNKTLKLREGAAR